jgi:hypothetical protein
LSRSQQRQLIERRRNRAGIQFICDSRLTMTALEALAILEAATLECKKREADTAELRAGLDFLEPHIQPAC